jgi:hypothetical protein
VSSRLEEAIRWREKRAGMLEAQITRLFGGNSVTRWRTVPPLIPVVIPDWLFVGAKIKITWDNSEKAVHDVLEVDERMCLIGRDGKSWAAETEILVQLWDPAG